MSVLRLGLRANLGQFSLLALDNVFVGMLVGSERTVVPLLGAQRFAVTSTAMLLAFVVAFGIVKGPLNLVAGRLADRFGRRRVLLAGWALGLPVPWLLLFAPSWTWVIVANLLLGANQGFAWSMTVTSKIDLVGRHRRGVALGINEFSGYVGVALASAMTGFLASQYGLRPVPFLFAGIVAIAGYGLALFVRETAPHVALEQAARDGGATNVVPRTRDIFADVTWRNPTLRACSLAGALNKFSDTGVWVLLPIAMAAQGFGVAVIGAVAGTYAFVWGVAQLLTGAISDRIGRKLPIVFGLVLDAAGLAIAGFARTVGAWTFAAALAGLGTAALYPVLLAAVSDVAPPASRATSLGVYRMWRDGGYALGGIAIGLAAQRLNAGESLVALAVALLVCAGFVQWWMRETHLHANFAGASRSRRITRSGTLLAREGGSMRTNRYQQLNPVAAAVAGGVTMLAFAFAIGFPMAGMMGGYGFGRMGPAGMGFGFGTLTWFGSALIAALAGAVFAWIYNAVNVRSLPDVTPDPGTPGTPGPLVR